jgi:hypothetical protein
MLFPRFADLEILRAERKVLGPGDIQKIQAFDTLPVRG